MKYALVITMLLAAGLIGCEKQEQSFDGYPQDDPASLGPAVSTPEFPDDEYQSRPPAVDGTDSDWSNDGEVGRIDEQPAEPADSGDGTSTYVVRKGDGLMSIARRELGDASRWREILKLNPEIQDPDKIKVGQTLKLPAK